MARVLLVSTNACRNRIGVRRLMPTDACRKVGSPSVPPAVRRQYMSPPPPATAAPRLWGAISLACLGALFVAIVATFQDYGISWDEEVQNIYGTKLLAFYTSGFKDRGALSFMNLYFYGGFFDLVAAALNTVLPFGIYETRHLWGALFFLFGLVGAWKLAELLAGPRAAALAVLLLGVNALMYGHGFINPKDAPFGWLSLWLIFFAGRAILEGVPRTGTILGFAVVAGLALGTRILSAPLIGYVFCAMILGAILKRFNFQLATPVGRIALAFGAALPLVYAVMALCWPWAVQAPFNPIVALHEFANFPWTGDILWNGKMVSANDLPRSYLLLLLGVQLSEAILLGLAFAVCAGFAAFLRDGFSLLDHPKLLPLSILIAAAVVPLAGFMILTPTIYNGLRHFLFVIPPLGIVAALGWNWAFAVAAARGRAFSAITALVLAAVFIPQIVTMVRMHPYQYIAYNMLIGGLPGAAGRFELDYWDTSLRDAGAMLADRIAKAGEGPPQVFVCGNQVSAMTKLPPGSRHTFKVEEADYLMSIEPSPCGYIADVTRNRILQIRREGVVLSYVIDLRAQRAGANSE